MKEAEPPGSSVKCFLFLLYTFLRSLTILTSSLLSASRSKFICCLILSCFTFISLFFFLFDLLGDGSVSLLRLLDYPIFLSPETFCPIFPSSPPPSLSPCESLPFLSSPFELSLSPLASLSLSSDSSDDSSYESSECTSMPSYFIPSLTSV